MEEKAKETWAGEGRKQVGRGLRETSREDKTSLGEWQAEEDGKERKKQAWKDSDRKLLLWKSSFGKRPPNSWYYHSSAISYGLQNTLDRHRLSHSMSSWRTQQPATAFYRLSHQWSGWESKRSHLIWPMWTEGALGCFLPFLSASFLFG